MKVSLTGALVGAVIGAGARSAVLLLNLGQPGSLVFVLPSAAIGVLVGLIAGATARPLAGALIGAVLSAIVFELFMLPCASLIGTFGAFTGNKAAGADFLRQTLIYALEMGVAGLLAGGIGGWAGRRAQQAKTESTVTDNEPESRA